MSRPSWVPALVGPERRRVHVPPPSPHLGAVDLVQQLVVEDELRHERRHRLVVQTHVQEHLVARGDVAAEASQGRAGVPCETGPLEPAKEEPRVEAFEELVQIVDTSPGSIAWVLPQGLQLEVQGAVGLGLEEPRHDVPCGWRGVALAYGHRREGGELTVRRTEPSEVESAPEVRLLHGDAGHGRAGPEAHGGHPPPPSRAARGVLLEGPQQCGGRGIALLEVALQILRIEKPAQAGVGPPRPCRQSARRALFLRADPVDGLDAAPCTCLLYTSDAADDPTLV